MDTDIPLRSWVTELPSPPRLHPPLFSFVLAALDLIGVTTADAHRLALAVLSSGAIVAMGFLGRRLYGTAAGLVAAAIAAVDPLWIQPSGKILSESIYLVLIPLMLLAALRCIDRPSLGRFGVTGLLIGFAALTRSEGAVFLLFLGVPLVIFGSRQWLGRLRWGLVLVAGFAIVLLPWLIRDEIELGGFTVSTNSGTTLIGAYNRATFAPHNPLYGSFDDAVQFGISAYLYKYSHPPNHAKHWTELSLNNDLGRIGRNYAKKHLSELPGVVLAREGRLWGIYDTGQQLKFDLASDGDGVWWAQVGGQYLNWLLIPLAIGGGAVLFGRSRRALFIVFSPILVAAVTAAATFGSTRYRAVAEPSLAVLAAIFTVWLVTRLIAPKATAASTADDPVPNAHAPTS